MDPIHPIVPVDPRIPRIERAPAATPVRRDQRRPPADEQPPRRRRRDPRSPWEDEPELEPGLEPEPAEERDELDGPHIDILA